MPSALLGDEVNADGTVPMGAMQRQVKTRAVGRSGGMGQSDALGANGDNHNSVRCEVEKEYVSCLWKPSVLY
jgi:hypothetical protein